MNLEQIGLIGCGEVGKNLQRRPPAGWGRLMLDILAITGPIYITIALGFATTRLGCTRIFK